MIPFQFTPPSPAAPDERRILLPAQIETKAALFALLLREIPLPDYFGHNWDALEECLGELDGLDLPKIILIHHDIPLEKRPADQRIYLQILASTARASSRVVIFFPETCRLQVARLLGAAK